MPKERKPLLSDEYLDELANEINQLYGSNTQKKQDETLPKKDEENKS
ncbi:hypothetical protein [Bacillus marasmi]|nr:hypothetical protein [Bacillus marasmi]